MKRLKLRLEEKVFAAALAVTVAVGLAGAVALIPGQGTGESLADLAHSIETLPNGRDISRSFASEINAVGRTAGQVSRRQQRAQWALVVMLLLICGAITGGGLITARLVARRLSWANHTARNLGTNKQEDEENIDDAPDDLGSLVASFERLMAKSQSMTERLETRDWNDKQIKKLVRALATKDEEAMADRVVKTVCTTVDAPLGALYISNQRADETRSDHDSLEMFGSYAYSIEGPDKDFRRKFRVGEALVGQAAQQKQSILLRNAPKDYVRIASGAGHTLPRFINLIPLVQASTVVGVLELGLLHEPEAKQRTYLGHAAPLIGVVLQGLAQRRYLKRELRSSEEVLHQMGKEQQKLFAANTELKQQLGRTSKTDGGRTR